MTENSQGELKQLYVKAVEFQGRRTEDNNDEPRRPVDAALFDISFYPNIRSKTCEPPKSPPFATERNLIRLNALFDNMENNYEMYFADFYSTGTPSGQHWVKLVLCERGSEDQAFCEEKLHLIPRDNPFFQVQEDRSFKLNSVVGVEIISSKETDIDIGRVENVEQCNLRQPEDGHDEHTPKQNEQEPKQDEQEEQKTPKNGQETPQDEQEPKQEEQKTPKDEQNPKQDEQETPKDEQKPKQEEPEPEQDEQKTPKDEQEPKQDEQKTPKDEQEPKQDEQKTPKDEQEPKQDEQKTPKDEQESKQDEREPKQNEREPKNEEKPKKDE